MSFNDGSSKNTENANTSQNSVSQSSGATTVAPVNADQLRQALTTSGNLYNAYEPYSGAAGTQGLQQVLGGGQNAFGLANGAANGEAAATLGGNFLSAGNPYFKGMVGQLGDALKPQIDGQFAAAGRYGSGANANAFADALSREAGNLAFQNYGAERQNQLGTLGQVPGLGQAMTAPGMTALQAGYTPIQQYLSALGSISPGKTSATTNNSSMSGTGTSQGVTNGSTSSKGLNIA